MMQRWILGLIGFALGAVVATVALVAWSLGAYEAPDRRVHPWGYGRAA